MGKEKLLVTSNFSFSCSVFKRLLLQTRKNQGLFGKGLINCVVCYYSGVEVDVTECSVVMGQVPGQSFNFSDHEGVTATLRLENKADNGNGNI